MAIKNFKSITNGTRNMSKLVNEEITKSTPEKSLLVTLKKNGGRNNQGKITLRHRGGGAKMKQCAMHISLLEKSFQKAQDFSFLLKGNMVNTDFRLKK